MDQEVAASQSELTRESEAPLAPAAVQFSGRLLSARSSLCLLSCVEEVQEADLQCGLDVVSCAFLAESRTLSPRREQIPDYSLFSLEEHEHTACVLFSVQLVASLGHAGSLGEMSGCTSVSVYVCGCVYTYVVA